MNSKKLDQVLNQLSTSPQKSKNKMPRTALNREAGFWKLLKDSLKKINQKIELTRIENWAVQGLPDVLVCSEEGKFSFIELKVSKTNAVKLSPHQVSWLTRHSHSNSFIFVRDRNLTIHIFTGSVAVDLSLDDISGAKSLATFSEPYDWQKIWDLTTN